MAYSATLSALNRPDAVGPLIIEPVTQASVALRVSTVWQTDSQSVVIPKITDDPSADWLPENTEIPASEATGDSISVTPKKLAGITYIANELADDTSPEAGAIIGQRLAADMGHKIDRAFFGSHITDDENPDYNAARPLGLESIPLVNLSRIDANPTGSSLDAFAEAVAAAEAQGVTIENWVTTPAIKLALRKLKTATGSNSYLLDYINGQLTVHGAPVLSSPQVTTGSVWGLPPTRAYTVLRKDVEVRFDTSVRFQFDQIAVRGVMRLAFGFPHTKGIVLIRD